jgi:hypothetical protein
MARSAGLLLLKWLIIPAALAAAGYFFIGPRVGKYVSAVGTEPATVEASSGEAATTTSDQQTNFPAPDVEVKVGGAASNVHRPKRKRRKRSTKPKPPVTVKAPDQAAPPPDQGGSGGAATTGGDTGTTGGGDTGGAGG